MKEKNKDEYSLQTCECKPCKPGECDEDNECVCECEDKVKGEKNEKNN